MKNHFIPIAIIHLTLALSCSAQAYSPATHDSVATVKDKTKQEPFLELNEEPIRQIKEIIKKLLAMYQQGQSDLPSNFSIEANFNIERNGSLTSIIIKKSSSSRVIDQKALEILTNASDSHFLVILMDLSSNKLRFDLTEKGVRLVITGSSADQSEAKAKAEKLSQLFNTIREAKKNTIIAELLSVIRVKSEGKQVDIEMNVSRARAGELMRAWIGY